MLHPDRQRLLDEIFSINSTAEFSKAALSVFHYQVRENPVYQQFVEHLDIDPLGIQAPEEIPFLPVDVFKNFRVITGLHDAQTVFTSSGTTGEHTSRHFVPDLSVYEKSFRLAFRRFYGNIEDYCILALLPSYLDREGSSLIYMAEDMIRNSRHAKSGFYLKHSLELAGILEEQKILGQKTILLGVTFALLDFAAEFPILFPELVVMETGGMKGRRKEIVREEVHALLRTGFGVSKIHSEYGMTELLSQAYSQGDGRFLTPPWMKVFIRDINDPLAMVKEGITGGISIVDLANLDSLAFIATQDLGKMHADHSFEVLGRYDYSDIRGCNLLVL